MSRSATPGPWSKRGDRLLSFLEARFLWLAGALSLLAFLTVYLGNYQNPPIRSDGAGYYAYLPALFLHGDLSMKGYEKAKYEWPPKLTAAARHIKPYTYVPRILGLQKYTKTNALLNRYTLGEALMLLPFFLAGHGLTLMSDQPRNGFSFFYQYSVGLAGLCYMLVGLLFLRSLLRRYFDRGVVLATLTCILLGTNLFHYGTYDALFSHIYSFCLFCLFLYFIPLWYEGPNYKRSCLLGFLMALILLVRPANLLVLLFFPLYDLNRSGLKRRARFLFRQYRYLLLMLALFCLTLLPQFIYWKFLTGKWILFSYQNSSFNFANPQFFEVLFSARKGLLFWSPLLLLALFGLWKLRSHAPGYWLPSLVVLPLILYLISSWPHWWFGKSYGHRGFVETLAILAIGLAALFSSLKWRWLKGAVGLVCLWCLFLSTAQMLQYWKGITPQDGTTRLGYQQRFLKFASPGTSIRKRPPFWHESQAVKANKPDKRRPSLHTRSTR